MSIDSEAVTDETVTDESTDARVAGTDDNEDGNRSGRGRLTRSLLVLTAVVAVAALAAAAVLGTQLRNARAVDDAARAASEAARQFAVTLTSVDSASLDADFAAVLRGSTGEFAQMYAESSEQLEQLLIDNQARAEGVVVESGIKSATTTKVEVLLFVDQSVTNTLVPEPRLDRSRVVMTMELADGRWLASKVDLP
ncbi:hypothetical protein [Rhodococcus sp. NPDC047139]|uniref:hypothetical protein n=1 Tax=Rhodococcus sp. NPDC047139 TaxID=3155141 RepID=UPI0033FE5734